MPSGHRVISGTSLEIDGMLSAPGEPKEGTGTDARNSDLLL